MDTIEDPGAPDPAKVLDVGDLKDRIADSIARLPEREKLVIALYYYENLTLREIGEVLGVTESRVSQRIPRPSCGCVRACRARPSSRSERSPLWWHASQGKEPRMRPAADRIRNVALVGHRGAGKTSLHEALLFEAGVINRLGSVPEGSTVSDGDPDEQARQMSISATLSAFDWHERHINLLDTPGEPSFIADALGALRVCESAIFVVNGVMGVEVSTDRLWARAAELDLARMLFVNMLDRERADFFRTLEQLKKAFGQHVVATEIPMGAEHDLKGVIDLVDMQAFRQDSAERSGFTEIPIPEEYRELAEEYREKLMDEVAEVSDALMERYLEGEEISHQEIVDALKEGTNHGSIFPVVCGVATGNLGTSRLLDAIVEDLPSPVKHGPLHAGELDLEASPEKELFAYVFKTRADPFAGRINLFRVYQGTIRRDSHAANTRSHAKERIGQLLSFAGREVEHLERAGARGHRSGGQAQGDARR